MSPSNDVAPESPEGEHGSGQTHDPYAFLYRGEEAADSGAEPLPGVPRASYHVAIQVGGKQYPRRPAELADTEPAPKRGGSTAEGGDESAVGRRSWRSWARSAGGRAGAEGVVRAVAVGLAVAAAVALARLGVGTDLATTGNADPHDRVSAVADGSSSPSSGADSKSLAVPGIARPTGGSQSTDAVAGPVDAASTTLVGDPAPTNNHPGARSLQGVFVPLVTPGQGIVWTVSVPTGGSYRFWVRYDNAAGDATATVVVNAVAARYPIRLSNFARQTDWDKAWAQAQVTVELRQGRNTVGLTVGQGQGGVNIDQFALTVSEGPSPW